MDFLDIFTAFDGDIMDARPLNVGIGEYGQSIGFNRIEEVEGSNPARYTKLP